MTTQTKPKRSLWIFGFAAEEPTYDQRVEHAAKLSQHLGVTLTAPHIPDADDLTLRAPRITPPASLATFCVQDNWERAYHAYGADRSRYHRVRRLPESRRTSWRIRAPRLSSRPLLEWCSDAGHIVRAVRRRLVRGRGRDAAGRPRPGRHHRHGPLRPVLEIDEVSRAARIQAGVFGPDLEDQLRPHGYTLRHFPQSFAAFDARRLDRHALRRPLRHEPDAHRRVRGVRAHADPARLVGAAPAARRTAPGPTPNRIVIGSEGILGIITEAWMRIQARPTFRATAGVRFPSWRDTYEATRAHRAGEAVAGEPARARPAPARRTAPAWTAARRC